jgi:ribosomal protein S18 acetylase RimI-like enzyme
MGAPVIRQALPADVAQLHAIARAAYAKYVERLGREPAPMGADFATHVAAGHVAIVATVGSPLGYMVAWPRLEDYFVDNIAVDPAHQGTGLGRLLLSRAIEEAVRLNLPALRLHTNVAMTENIAIYRRIGFVETHRAVENGYHRVHMRLDLSGGRT